MTNRAVQELLEADIQRTIHITPYCESPDGAYTHISALPLQLGYVLGNRDISALEQGVSRHDSESSSSKFYTLIDYISDKTHNEPDDPSTTQPLPRHRLTPRHHTARLPPSAPTQQPFTGEKATHKARASTARPHPNDSRRTRVRGTYDASAMDDTTRGGDLHPMPSMPVMLLRGRFRALSSLDMLSGLWRDWQQCVEQGAARVPMERRDAIRREACMVEDGKSGWRRLRGGGSKYGENSSG